MRSAGVPRRVFRGCLGVGTFMMRVSDSGGNSVSESESSSDVGGVEGQREDGALDDVVALFFLPFVTVRGGRLWSSSVSESSGGMI